MYTTNVGILLPFEAIFDDCEDYIIALKTIIEKYSPMDIIKRCANITNYIVLNPNVDSIQCQRNLVEDYFYTSAYKRLIQFERENKGQQLQVFFRAQLQNLIRWTFVFGHTEKSDEISKDDFLKLTLLSSSEWSSRIFKKYEDSEDITEERKKYALSFRNSIAGNSRIDFYHTALVRTKNLIKLYRECFPKFDELYKKTIGISYDTIFDNQTYVYSNLIMNKDKKGSFNIKNETGLLDKIKFNTYLERFSSDFFDFSEDALEQYREGKNPNYLLHKWRKTPILYFEAEQEFIILDPEIFIDNIIQGPVFSISRQDENALISFGEAFEKHICSIFHYIYPDSGLAKRLFCDESIYERRDIVGQIDAYINNGESVIVCEMKLSFFREDLIANSDADAYIQEINNKFIETDQGQPKGITQLKSIIEKICQEIWSGKSDELKGCNHIIPVIITNDPLICEPLVQNYLCKCFQKQLGIDSDTCLGFFHYEHHRIENVIVLSVDDIENLEFTSDNISVKDLFIGYSDSHPERLLSFYDYLISSHHKEIKRNERMNEETKQLIDDFMIKYDMKKEHKNTGAQL